MVVCKFFQQGYCRYGQNCRFEHIYGSKYSYFANPTAQSNQTQQTQAATVVTDEQLVNQVQSDIQAALKGGQWILSSYAPYKEKPAFPGLSDLSPEEARLFIYEAKANNTLDQAVEYANNLLKEARYKYEQLLQPSVNVIKILRSLYKGEPVSALAASQTSGFATATNAASSIFRSALNSTPTVHNTNTTSIFNQNTNQSIFGTAMQDNTAPKSIFAQANQAFGHQGSPNLFQTNPNESTTPKSIFAQENQKIFGPTQTGPSNPTNIFASASQSVFGKPSDPFGQTNAFQSQPANIFQKPDQPQTDIFKRTEPQNIFGVANNIFEQSTNSNEDNIYSRLEELTEDDIKAFESNDFKLGFIPEVPPPQSLCI